MPGAAPALVVCVLWILVFLQYRESFKGILAAKPAAQGIFPIAARRDHSLLAADWDITTPELRDAYGKTYAQTIVEKDRGHRRPEELSPNDSNLAWL